MLTIITVLSSDHPHFPAGSRAAVQVARGRIVQLGIYAVRSQARAGDRVSLRTGLGDTFTVSASDYDALCGARETEPIDAAEATRWVGELQPKAR